MKKTNFKKQVAVIMLALLLALILPQTSKAGVLQANPTTNTTPTKLQGQYLLSNVRTMETTGQAMGLAETIDETTKLWTTDTVSNNIDVHMMKSTEYGAMAILSSSGFGNPASTKTIDTTTGNKTGVYMQTATSEWVAGAGTGATGMSGSSIAHRYFNTYTTSSDSSKAGDALGLGWHSASCSWLGASYGGFYCGGSLGVFGYGYGNTSMSSSMYASRAVVVSGTGF